MGTMPKLTPLVALTALALGALACELVSGVDDFAVAGAGGSATAGSTSEGGSTGTAGGGGTSGTAGGGGVAGGGGAPPLPCSPGNTDTLVDDFEDGMLGAPWGPWSDGDVSVEENGGELRFGLGINSYHYGGVFSLERYNLQECAITVELTRAPNPGANTAEGYLVARSNDNRLMINVYGSRLYVDVRVNGTISESEDIVFDHTIHRWWRIRETGGNVFLETSADGLVWNVNLTRQSPGFVTNIEIGMLAGTWQPQGSPGRVEFDSFNVPPGG
jgi:hypothetical protein